MVRLRTKIVLNLHEQADNQAEEIINEEKKWKENAMETKWKKMHGKT